MSCSGDKTATDADPHVRTACALAASVISFCSNHQLQMSRDMTEFYNRLASNGFKGSVETLNLQMACCRTICELTQAAPEVVRKSLAERKEWIELLSCWKTGVGSSEVKTDALKARAALCSLGASNGFSQQSRRPCPFLPATAQTIPAGASGAKSASIAPAYKTVCRVAVSSTSLKSSHSATIEEALGADQAAVPVTATTGLAENAVPTMMQPPSVPPSSMMWLNLHREKKMDPGVPKEACSIATKLVSFFGANLPSVSCDDLDKASIYKTLYLDQDCTKETKALQKACCQKIRVAIERAPDAFKRHEHQFKTVLVQWLSDDCDPDLRREASEAIAALDPLWSPPRPQPMIEHVVATKPDDIPAKPFDSGVNHTFSRAISPSEERTKPPASFGRTEIVKSLESTPEGAQLTLAGNDEFDESLSLTAGGTPGDAATKASVRGITPSTVPSVDSTSITNDSADNIVNAAEPANPLEMPDGETTETMTLRSGVFDSMNETTPAGKFRAHSAKEARTSNEQKNGTRLTGQSAKAPSIAPAALQTQWNLPCINMSQNITKVFGKREYYKIVNNEARKVPLLIDSIGRSALQGLRPNDVVLGRGCRTKNFPGNQAFRNVVWDYKPTYLNSKRDQKSVIAAAVVGKVMRQKPPGRFVEMLSGDYFIVPYDRAVEKAAQALREQTSQQRIKLLQRKPKKRKRMQAYEEMHTLDAPKTKTKQVISIKANNKTMERRSRTVTEENTIQPETHTNTKQSRSETAARAREQVTGAGASEWSEISSFPAADVLATSPSPTVWYVRPPLTQEPNPDYGQPKLPYPMNGSMQFFLRLRLAEIETIRNQQGLSLSHG